MRNLKRALSLAVASVMLLGMMVVGTGAYDDVTASHNEEAIAVMEAAGIMIGDDAGNFNPEQKVTRNQMAVVMCNVLGYEAPDYAGVAPFTDVPAWAESFVSACYANGIVAGVSATEYNGEGTVTAAEAGLMLMKALGWFAFGSDFGDDWQLAVVTKASEIDLFDGMKVNARTPLTRNDVAQLVLNALESTKVKGTMSGTTGSVTAGDVKVELQGTVNYNNVYSEAAYADTIKVDNYVQLGEDLFDGDLVKTPGYVANSYGAPSVKWEFDNEEVGKFAIDPEKVYTVDFDADEVTDLVDNDYVLSGADVYVNGALTALDADDVAARDYVGTTVKLYSTHATNDKIITDIVIEQGYLAKVTAEDDKNIFVTIYNPWGSNDAVYYADNTKKDNDTYDKLSAAYDEDDYFMIFVNGADTRNAVIAHAAVESADVKVATTKIVTPGFGGYFTADGVKYELASAYNEVALTIGDEYTIFFDEAGYVIGAELIEEAAPTLEDVFYVVKVWKETDTKYGTENTDTWYAQIVDMEGVTSEIVLEKDYSALTKALVTKSDKKWSETVEVDGVETTKNYKADNDKFDLAVWNPTKTWDKDVATYTGVTFAKDDARKNLGSVYRLNADTKYIMIGEAGSDLAVKVATGGIALNANGMTGFVVTEKDKTVAKYVIIASAAEITGATEFSSDLIFVNTVDSETGDGYIAQEVIFADGSKKVINIDLADDNSKVSSLSATTFYSYDVNEDGYYVLSAESTDVPALTIVGETWKDEEGVANGSFVDLFENLLTVGSYVDIDVTNAKFVDAHDVDADGQYDSLVANLAALNDLDDMDNYTTSATLYLSVEEDGAVVVILTSLTHTYSAI